MITNEVFALLKHTVDTIKMTMGAYYMNSGNELGAFLLQRIVEIEVLLENLESSEAFENPKLLKQTIALNNCFKQNLNEE